MNKLLNIKSCKSSSVAYTKQSGFSLIEVMVAALVLSIGILGVASLQIIGLKGTQQSYMKQQAMSVVQSLIERMRSNKQGVLDGNYLLTTNENEVFDCSAVSVSNCSTETSNCDSEAIAKADLHNLVCGYKTATSSRTGGIKNIDADDIGTFLDGKLTISCTNATGCSTGDIGILVNWTERALGKEKDSDPGRQDSLLINTRISP